MNVDLIFKIAAVGVLVAVTEQVLVRAGRQDIAAVVALLGLATVLLAAVSAVGELFQTVRTLFVFP